MTHLLIARRPWRRAHSTRCLPSAGRSAGLAGVALATTLVLLFTTSCAENEKSARWPGWGFTHTQFSADQGRQSAVTAATEALARQRLAQNQHIMGWGASNPEPSPGSYDFDSLDSRIEFIRQSDGFPIITLCCAPDWMKGGEPGQTDWSRLIDAPLPEHYADFAALSAAIARRYPDVRHFMVWNELKGFYDDQNDRWDAQAYTDLYNQVYDAIKAVNPDNLVGGPYLSMASISPDSNGHASSLRGAWGTIDQNALDAFDFWLQHKHGADFVVVDGQATTKYGAPDEFTALEKFSAVSRWIQERTDLPLWWSEWYVEPTQSGWSDQQRVAVRVAAMIEMATSGVNTALYWNPTPGWKDCPTCLWTDTEDRQGGQPLPFLDTLQAFAEWFPPGTPLRDVEAPSTVRILAQDRMIVLVNTVDQPVTVVIDGSNVRVDPYETRWVPRQAP